MLTNMKDQTESEEPIKEHAPQPEVSGEIAEPVLEAEKSAMDPEAVSHEQLRKQIEEAHLDDASHQSAQSQAAGLKDLGEEKKIEHLLALAKKKGVVYAVNVAKKMNDPYLLDMLHDLLAKEGMYKSFLK